MLSCCGQPAVTGEQQQQGGRTYGGVTRGDSQRVLAGVKSSRSGRVCCPASAGGGYEPYPASRAERVHFNGGVIQILRRDVISDTWD